ncbi:MAG: hypothetical protein LBU43_05710 [Candidatus Accumulibacter sp.]|jgi:hypothetical protein|nr:hypothetical protein [Accumulibacter sp.]
MGEKIRDLPEITIADARFRLEINGSSNDGGEREIHIHAQNNKFRMALSERDFFEMGTGILLARKQLELLKGMSTDEGDNQDVHTK